MIRHVALFTFREPWPPARVAALGKAIAGLAEVPGVIRAAGRPALGWQAGADYLMAVDVADRAGFDAYKRSPQHLALIEAHIKPMVATTTRIQIVIDGE